MKPQRVRWAWFLVACYGIHLGEEYFLPPGLWSWVESHFPIAFSHFHWVAVNLPFFGLFAFVVALEAKRPRDSWASVAVATHLGLHGLMHGIHSLITGTVPPGVVSGLVLCLPASALIFLRAIRSRPRAPLRLGLVAGVVSFPPFIHFAVLALLGLRAFGGPA